MEIVIKIPKQMYLNAKADTLCGSDVLVRAIKNGVPLPKGHGALKGADKLAVAIAMIRDRWNGYGNEYESATFQAYDNSVDEIIDAPTIVEADNAESEEKMSRKITMPKCPYCGEEKKYQLGEYDTSKLVSLATGTCGSEATIRCTGCGKDYKVSCNIRYYGRK